MLTLFFTALKNCETATDHSQFALQQEKSLIFYQQDTIRILQIRPNKMDMPFDLTGDDAIKVLAICECALVVIIGLVIWHYREEVKAFFSPKKGL